MTKTQANRIIKQIDKHMAMVGKERDELDKFIDDLEGLKESCSEAYDNLHFAREALSQFV